MVKTPKSSDLMAAMSAMKHAPMDVNRIIGVSGTIALNILLLMLLLAPLSQPGTIGIPDITPTLDWIEAKPVKPAPAPPLPVEVVRRPQQAQPEARPDVATAAVEPVQVDAGTLPVQSSVTAPTATIAVPSIEPTAASTGTRLEYLEAPAPRYPRELLLAGIEGTVLLQVLVGVDGHPAEVSVQQSSGHREFDQAARRQVLRYWRFRPAMQAGRAVQAIGIVPIEFKLGR